MQLPGLFNPKVILSHMAEEKQDDEGGGFDAGGPPVRSKFRGLYDC